MIVLEMPKIVDLYLSKMSFKMLRPITYSVFISISLCSCSSRTPNYQDQGALGGAALGAGLGAIVGNQVGGTAEGLAVGAVTGGVVGGLIGKKQEDLEESAAEQDIMLRNQRMEFERQEREMRELRRQQYYDSRIQDYQKEPNYQRNQSKYMDEEYLHSSPNNSNISKPSYPKTDSAGSSPLSAPKIPSSKNTTAPQPQKPSYDEGQSYEGSIYKDTEKEERSF
jgi:Glycine zipper